MPLWLWLILKKIMFARIFFQSAEIYTEFIYTFNISIARKDYSMDEIRINIIGSAEEREHSHQEIEILYVLEGELSLRIADEKYTLHKNDIILVNSAKRHSYFTGNKSLCCRIYIDYGFIVRSSGSHFVSFWCNSLIDKDDDYRKLKSILDSLIREWKSASGHDTLYMNSQKYMLADCLVRNFMIQSGSENDGYGDGRVEKMLGYIGMHYADNISLGEIAKEMYMSESSASRLFKKVTGSNFVDYVNLYRLNYATEDLLYSSKSITQIAVDCGFSSPSVFNKLFNKVYGCSPTTYRTQKLKTMESAVSEKSNETENINEKLEKWINEGADSSHAKQRLNSISVAAGSPLQRFGKECCKCVEFGMAADILEGSIQRQLKDMRDSLGLEYIKIGGFFHERMFLQNGTRGVGYNFSHMNTVLDYITELGLKPIIDLSYDKRKVSYRDLGEILFEDKSYKLNLKPHEWERLLSAVLNHVINRYGEELVQKWYFTLEKAADLYGENADTSENYPIIWEKTYSVIKNIDSNLSFGGDINLLEHKLETGTEADFYTVKIFPYTREVLDGDVYSRRTTEPHFVKKEIQKCRKLLELKNQGDKLLLVSEWNTSVSERNSYNDSCAKAAHAVAHMIDSIGLHVLMCYHQGSDYLSQYYDTNAFLTGASGMVTKDGVAKPVWYAFSFMNRLYQNIVAKGEHFIITENNKNAFKMILCNPKAFSHSYYLKSESEITADDLDDIFENSEDESTEITICNIPDGEYLVKREILKTARANVQTEWKNMGYAENLSLADIDYMKHVCRPIVYSEKKSAKNNSINLCFNLRAHEITIISVVKIAQ